MQWINMKKIKNTVNIVTSLICLNNKRWNSILKRQTFSCSNIYNFDANLLGSGIGSFIYVYGLFAVWKCWVVFMSFFVLMFFLESCNWIKLFDLLKLFYGISLFRSFFQTTNWLSRSKFLFFLYKNRPKLNLVRGMKFFHFIN